MRYNVLGYLVGEGFRNVFKNKKSTGASLMIMCATMLIFGLFFVIGENVNHMVKEVESQQGMQVFLNKEVTEAQITQVGEQIRKLDNVGKVEYVSKEDALDSLKVRFGDKGDLLNGYYEKNPLKPSYVVTLTDLEKSDEVKAQIEGLENVSNIEVRDKTIEALINVANGIRIVSGVILVLLIVISVFIIANTIKLTVHARRKEISIMKYVGATNGFIRWPFIVEGMIIGIISALISILLLGLSYNFATEKLLTSSITSMVEFSLLTFSDIFGLVMMVYLGLGIGIGILGSVISMRKYLEV
ncbi:MAG: permease-like cell division protein FtsX [Clostridia bacterium]